MLKIIIKRILQVIPTLLVVVTFTFIVTRMIPGDPATAMVGDNYDAVKLEELRESMGLNESISKQYVSYLKDILRGNFGYSYYFKCSALEQIAQRLPNTLVLTLTSLAIAATLGTVLGILSARWQGSVADYVMSIVSLFGVSAPVFWVAIMLVMIFAVNLGWLPTFGMADLAKDGWVEFLRHMCLPCACLSVIPMATFMRISRSSMIEALGNDSITCLRARGIREKSILWKHALKNALPPIVTILGIQLAGCFSGAVLTENIFSWPGMGTMITSAINNRDYSLIQATVLVIALAFVIINLLTDLAYMAINPKVANDAKNGGM